MNPYLETDPEEAVVGHTVWAYYRVLGEAIKIPLTVLAVYPDGSFRGDPAWGEA